MSAHLGPRRQCRRPTTAWRDIYLTGARDRRGQSTRPARARSQDRAVVS